jgi:hypothetical protein
LPYTSIYEARLVEITMDACLLIRVFTLVGSPYLEKRSSISWLS